MNEFLRRLDHFLNRRRFEAELEEEISHHLALNHLAMKGAKQFGNVTLIREDARSVWTWTFLEQLAQDIRYGLRSMAANKLFTAMAVLSLALGIGANTAIYSFMDAILIRALPVAHPEKLVVLNWRAKGWPEVAHSQHGSSYEEPGGVSVSDTLPYPAWELLRTNNALSSLLAFLGAGRLNIVIDRQAVLTRGAYTSGNYFDCLQMRPSAGRLIAEQDDKPGARPIAVISYPFWQARFAGAANAVGHTITVNGVPVTIAGVAAPGFYGLNPGDAPDLFLPIHLRPLLDPRSSPEAFHDATSYWIETVGRLRDGVTLRQAEASLAPQFHALVADSAKNDKERANLPALWLEEGGSGIDSLKRQYSKPLYVLMTMVGLILAIACANIANLLLARATSRRREIAVRLSLGAGRGRVIRQLLTESMLLSLAGGIAGLGIAAVGIRTLTWLLANGHDDFTLHARIDIRILLFATAVSLFTGIVFGLAPALQSTKIAISPALKESRLGTGRASHSGLRFGLMHSLVVAQIAVSLLLAIAAGLFVRTLSNLQSVTLGFNRENVLLFSLNAKQAGYNDARGIQFYDAMRRKFASIPGVTSATVTDMPLVAGWSSSTSATIPGVPEPNGKRPATNVALVGPSYFETMQIPILRGRSIEERDQTGHVASVVVNEVFAQKYFPGRDPVGQRFTLGGNKNATETQIVGVARNSRYASLKRDIPPVSYVSWTQPSSQWRAGGMYFALRTMGDPMQIANTIRQVVHEADANIPVADLTTQARRIDETIVSERTFTDLCACFGILALTIAAIGLYGTMAYAVARRTGEIGIRLALGAQRPRVLWMVLREATLMLIVGVVIGVGVAWWASRFLASFLFGVKPNDPASIAVSVAVLAGATILAGYFPAWRASRIDPMTALRHE